MLVAAASTGVRIPAADIALGASSCTGVPCACSGESAWITLPPWSNTENTRRPVCRATVSAGDCRRDAADAGGRAGHLEDLVARQVEAVDVAEPLTVGDEVQLAPVRRVLRIDVLGALEQHRAGGRSPLAMSISARFISPYVSVSKSVSGPRSVANAIVRRPATTPAAARRTDRSSADAPDRS